MVLSIVSLVVAVVLVVVVLLMAALVVVVVVVVLVLVVLAAGTLEVKISGVSPGASHGVSWCVFRSGLAGNVYDNSG